MIKKISSILFFGMGIVASHAQKTDTVIVDLTKTSKMMLTIQDRKDLETLKHYDFQKLFQDILIKLEKSDSTLSIKQDSAQVPLAKRNNGKDSDDNILQLPEHKDDDKKEDKSWEYKYDKKGKDWKWQYKGKHLQSFKVDLGVNNYLSNGKFPDQNNSGYVVRPWGSWYVGINSVHRTSVGRRVSLEWGAGISWYNFKFQDKSTFIQKTNDKVSFMPDSLPFNYIKSKLTATYINASFVPVIELGEQNDKPTFWNGHKSPFRVGLGPYVGYRIASHSKLVYDDANHHTEKEKNKDNFYLNNFRYGARLQLGFWHTDLFFNYDLNELFTSGKGPNLNAFSFGIII